MRNNNNKGFMLIETLLVSVFVVSTLIFVYVQFEKVRNSYQTSFEYNTINGVYGADTILKYLKENEIENLNNAIKDGRTYVDISNCPGGYLSNTSFCQRLLTDLKVKKIFYTTVDITEFKKNIDQVAISNKLKQFIRSIKSSDETGYRLIVEYEDDTYATILTNRKSTPTSKPTPTPKPTPEVVYSFATDSWDTIASVVKENPSAYPVGVEKEVTLTGEYAGTYTVRVANNTNPSECSGADFSQTACGFVVEFVDIISEHEMNADSTNVGGWPASELYTTVNTNIYNALPADLKSVIIDTKVVSSHGNSSGETNFTSTDKLYLLATKEIWGKISFDSSENQTRQLDYYKSKGVTTSNFAGAIKQYNGSNYEWWLRSAHSFYSDSFFIVTPSGDWYHFDDYISIGVAPAFRLR